MQPSFVAVCKNIKHYSVAKPHSGVPSPLSFFHKQLFVFERYSSPSLSLQVYLFLRYFFACRSYHNDVEKKIIKEICVRQELLIISERAKLWTSAILSDLNCWHLFYYSSTNCVLAGSHHRSSWTNKIQPVANARFLSSLSSKILAHVKLESIKNKAKLYLFAIKSNLETYWKPWKSN